MHYYATGTSFVRIECPYLKKAIKILRPTAVIPKRNKIGGELLDTCFNTATNNVNTWMKSATSILTLQTDGWTNVTSDSVVNYVGAAPDRCLFIEARPTGEQRHTAVWIAQDITRIINKYPGKFAGCVTDNTTTNKAALVLVEEEEEVVVLVEEEEDEEGQQKEKGFDYKEESEDEAAVYNNRSSSSGYRSEEF
jgi:hypothetical protein